MVLARDTDPAELGTALELSTALRTSRPGSWSHPPVTDAVPSSVPPLPLGPGPPPPTKDPWATADALAAGKSSEDTQ